MVGDETRSTATSADESGAAAYPVVLLWIIAVLFIGFGVGFAFAPTFFADFIIPGAAPSVPSAIIDMRATYGGPALGLGLFFVVATRRRQWMRPALVVSLLVIACIGAARLLGIIADGDPNAWMLFFLATEVISVALIVVALRRLDPGI